MPLSDDQIERYSRQIILPEVGARGQEQLLAAAVAVIGGDAVGATAVAYLSAAGVGRIDCSAMDEQAHVMRLVDDLNPEVELRWDSRDSVATLEPSSASPYDAILVATADAAVRERAAAAAVAHQVPVILAVASRGTGWVGVFSAAVDTRSCPGCAAPRTGDSTATAWLGDTAAPLIGALAALEVIVLLIGGHTPRWGRVLHFDAALSTMAEQPTANGPGCIVCAAHGSHP